MEARNLTRADIDRVRQIEGFPIGADEDIIALSNAPYYTACPNPFLGEFVRENGTPYAEETDAYHREPFAADVSEGKNDPIYTAHTYHTKVPYRAIQQYIEHYTQPGDIVFDGFAGSGMTGVAAEKAGRRAILCDLSPAAGFIASRYNLPGDPERFRSLARGIVGKLRAECGWMFETRHTARQEGRPAPPADAMGEIDYTVWSDVFICPNCGEEIVYWDAAVDFAARRVSDRFYCGHGHAQLSKRGGKRSQSVVVDKKLGKNVSLAKQVPVRINYTYAGKRYAKAPDENDLAIVRKIEALDIPYWYPTDALPDGYNTEQPVRSHGVTNVQYFFTKRVLYELALVYREISLVEDGRARNDLLSLLTGILNRNAYKCNRFVINQYNPSGRINGPKPGTLYIPSLVVEQNIADLLEYKIPQLENMFCSRTNHAVISTQSSTDLSQIPDKSVDYIFVDPPFGDNLNYSELSFLWEAWLKVRTANRKEAVINPVQKKSLHEYQELMTQCFSEFNRILKPNRWMTVEFHNSRNAVWNAIQEALSVAGFIVADVRTLDKQRASLHQLVASTAVQQDLAITCYKPKASFQRELHAKAGTADTAWSFVRQHLENIPVVVVKDGRIELIAERQAYLLFDRMVAYHIMNGIPVPMDSADFYRGLDENFLKRDGMYFLPDQVNAYDAARLETDVEQAPFRLLVTNEKTAISWLYRQLSDEGGGRQTYADLQPKFMQEVKTVDRYEDMPELAVLLEENFLQDEAGRWYIPDTAKEGDVAKLRQKKLWREFEGYLHSKGKLRQFRSEAVRAGFSRLWKEKNYQAIVEVAERLPEQTIQEDPNLLMYYDISLSRV